jgi:hypothetical protein
LPTQVPADLRPQLNPNEFNSGAFGPTTGPTSRGYTPIEVDPQPIVPLAPPNTPAPVNPQGSATPLPRKVQPFVPLTRPRETPASADKPARRLQLVPDPDAEKLELRKSDIPQLINPNDRHT